MNAPRRYLLSTSALLTAGMFAACAGSPPREPEVAALPSQAACGGRATLTAYNNTGQPMVVYELNERSAAKSIMEVPAGGAQQLPNPPRPDRYYGARAGRGANAPWLAVESNPNYRDARVRLERGCDSA